MDESSITSRMNSVLETIVNDIASIRTGRAMPGLVEGLTITVYGGTQKLKVQELATIAVVDSQTLTIDPWDKSIIGEIRQGILSSNVGINPNIDGEIIRISLPPMTSEDREKYVKLLHTKLETGRIMLRQIRSDAMKDIKIGFEDKSLTEDERFAQEKRLQEITDEFVGKIDSAGDAKEKELLQV